MHWLILDDLKKGERRDHRNRNGLDNRRDNLRVATASQNAHNTGLWAHNKSGYKGVGYNKNARKWKARITVRKNVIHIGYFNSAIEASGARKKAERKWIKNI